MKKLFDEFGTIKSAKLEVFASGESRGFGYIQFETQESAQAAIGKLHGSEQGGNKIDVLNHVKKDEREDVGENYTNLFVQNLPQDFTDAQLHDLFKEFGTIDSASVNLKKNGTGFVSYKEHDDAKRALETASMKLKVQGQAIIVSQHVSRKESDLVTKGQNPIVQNQKEAFKSNIFVRFIPKEVSEEELKAKFSEAGEILSVRLKEHVQKINGESFSNYNNGFVLYQDVQSAQRCIKMFDESNCFGFTNKALRVDFWQSKVDLKQQNEEKNAAGLKQLITYVM